MGCWNKTCGLTQLPIHDGERVITFLLVKKEGGYQSYCYNNWAWELIPLPIYGKYDDYGWMEADAGQEPKLKMLHHFTKDKLARRKPHREGIADGPEDLGWNAVDDVSSLKDKGYVRYDNINDDPFETFEALGEAMHGNLFGLKGWHGEVCEISHMMIREDAFNSLKTAVTLGDGFYPGVELEHLNKVLEAHDLWKNAQEEELAQKLEDANAAGDNDLAQTLKSEQFILSYMDDRVSDEIVETILHPLRKEYNVEVKYDHACVDYWFLNYARYPSHGSETGALASSFIKKFKKFLKFETIFDAYALANIFSELRKSYSPMGGEGSQNGTNVITTKFPLAYLEASHNIDHRWDEDDVEEEESPDMEMTKEKQIELLKRSANNKRTQALKLLREADEEFTKALLKKF